MKCRTTFEADRDIIDIYVLGAQQFGVAQSIAGTCDCLYNPGDDSLIVRILQDWQGLFS